MVGQVAYSNTFYLNSWMACRPFSYHLSPNTSGRVSLNGRPVSPLI